MDDLAGLLEGDALVGAQPRVLLGELVAQLAGARIVDRRVVQVDAEFRRAGTDLILVAENRQVGDAALQHPTGGLEDAVVVAFRQHDALAVRAGPLAQLIGEHLRRGHLGDRNRQLRQQVRQVDVALDQLQRGVDLALRRRGDPAACRPDSGRGVEGAERGGDDRQPQPQPGNQRTRRPMQLEPAVEDDARQRRKAFGGMRTGHREHHLGAVAGRHHHRSLRQPLQHVIGRHTGHHHAHHLAVHQRGVTADQAAMHGGLQIGDRRRHQQRLVGHGIGLRRQRS